MTEVRWHCAVCGKPGSLYGGLQRGLSDVIEMLRAGWRFAYGSAFCTDHRAERELLRDQMNEADRPPP